MWARYRQDKSGFKEPLALILGQPPRTLINSVIRTSGSELTFLHIMGRHLEVTDRRMAAAVKLVLAQPLIAGSPSLVRQ